MGRKKPCKPKPKEGWEGLYRPMTVNEAYIDRLYALTLGSPKLAHVLCPVHVK